MDELKAGRELDALIAEKVMGWHKLFGGNGIYYQNPLSAKAIVPPRFSADISAAWQVVERLEELGYWTQLRTPVSLEHVGNGGYWCGFTLHGCNGRPDHWTSATSQPLAICLAALRAV